MLLNLRITQIVTLSSCVFGILVDFMIVVLINKFLRNIFSCGF